MLLLEPICFYFAMKDLNDITYFMICIFHNTAVHACIVHLNLNMGMTEFSFNTCFQ